MISIDTNRINFFVLALYFCLVLKKRNYVTDVDVEDVIREMMDHFSDIMK